MGSKRCIVRPLSKLVEYISIIAPMLVASSRAQMEDIYNIHIPAEWEHHNGTYMVYPASAKIWKKAEYLDLVREDIIRIATAISKYEHVTLLTDPSQLALANKSIEGIKNIKLMSMPVNDLWARDTLPVFGYMNTTNSTELVGIDFNFNGWGNKQVHDKDSKVARTLLSDLGIQRIETKLVTEGGALETDGEGTLLITESSILNKNRNPEDNRDEIEEELKRVLGMKKVIWFDGVYGEDITDAHVDCLVRFVRPGVVILNRPPEGTPKGFDVWSNSSDQAKMVLENETDAMGRKFEVIDLYEPDPKKIVSYGDEFLSSYVNFFIANGAVIVPKFGDEKADLKAQKVLQDNFPGRTVVPVEMSNLASGGGGIHCATHEIPCNVQADGTLNSCSSSANRSGGFWF